MDKSTTKALLFAVLSMILLSTLTTAAYASVGVAISPAGGTINIPLEGGKFSFYIFNSGTEAGSYAMTVSGEGQKYVKFTDTTFTIEGGGNVLVEGAVEPGSAVIPGKEYLLSVKINTLPPKVEKVGILASASADFKIVFVTQPQASTAETPQYGGSGLLIPILLVILAIVCVYLIARGIYPRKPPAPSAKPEKTAIKKTRKR